MPRLVPPETRLFFTPETHPYMRAVIKDLVINRHSAH